MLKSMKFFKNIDFINFILKITAILNIKKFNLVAPHSSGSANPAAVIANTASRSGRQGLS